MTLLFYTCEINNIEKCRFFNDCFILYSINGFMILAKEPRSNSARQSRFSERSSEKPPGSAKRNQRIRKKDSHSSLGKFIYDLNYLLLVKPEYLKVKKHLILS